jgi:hypothetical protein
MQQDAPLGEQSPGKATWFLWNHSSLIMRKQWHRLFGLGGTFSIGPVLHKASHCVPTYANNHAQTSSGHIPGHSTSLQWPSLMQCPPAGKKCSLDQPDLVYFHPRWKPGPSHSSAMAYASLGAEMTNQGSPTWSS